MLYKEENINDREVLRIINCISFSPMIAHIFPLVVFLIVETCSQLSKACESNMTVSAHDHAHGFWEHSPFYLPSYNKSFCWMSPTTISFKEGDASLS